MHLERMISTGIGSIVPRDVTDTSMDVHLNAPGSRYGPKVGTVRFERTKGMRRGYVDVTYAGREDIGIPGSERVDRGMNMVAADIAEKPHLYEHLKSR